MYYQKASYEVKIFVRTLETIHQMFEYNILDVKQINITEKSIHWGDQEYADSDSNQLRQ